jgi:peptide/nickel transport system permease protein
MASEPAHQLALGPPAAIEDTGASAPATAVGPWRFALRRLRRSKTALASGVLFLLVVVACLAAPLWATHVAYTTPFENHLTDTVEVDGKTTNVVGLDGIPIGPTYQGRYFLGADRNGRDIMVRLLYGGRNSLVIAFSATLLTTVFALLFGLVAGYFGGAVDALIRAFLDVLWSFPVILLGVALGVALALGGLAIGPVTVSPGSLLIPILVIGVAGVPYVARPLRGLVLSLREKEFVEAARAQGAGPIRIIWSELLPNLSSTLIVLFTLLVANAVLFEAALSFLGAGVQPPTPSWGTMIADGMSRITTAPHLVIVPGLMLVVTVLSLNIVGDCLRDALDPHRSIRVDR